LGVNKFSFSISIQPFLVLFSCNKVFWFLFFCLLCSPLFMWLSVKLNSVRRIYFAYYWAEYIVAFSIVLQQLFFFISVELNICISTYEWTPWDLLKMHNYPLHSLLETLIVVDKYVLYWLFVLTRFLLLNFILFGLNCYFVIMQFFFWIVKKWKRNIT
jgi:hypothetical protein